MTELTIVNPDGAPVILPVSTDKTRLTLKQAKGKMTLAEAEPVQHDEQDLRVERATRLLKRKNRRTGTARRGKIKTEKGLKLNGRG